MTVTLRLPRKLLARLARHAARTGYRLPLSRLVEAALVEYLGRREPKGGRRP